MSMYGCVEMRVKLGWWCVMFSQCECPPLNFMYKLGVPPFVCHVQNECCPLLPKHFNIFMYKIADPPSICAQNWWPPSICVQNWWPRTKKVTLPLRSSSPLLHSHKFWMVSKLNMLLWTKIKWWKASLSSPVSVKADCCSCCQPQVFIRGF